MKRLVFIVGVVACLMVDLRLQAQVGTFRRLVDLVQPVTIADNGGGTPATATVAPNSRYIAITCSDADGCAVTLGETGIVNGQQLYIANISANAVTFADSAGVQELTSSVSLAQWSSMECEYLTDRWGCGGSGGGAGTVTTTGSPASGNLAAFSGASSITNTNLTGAVTTSGTVATTLAADIVGNTNLRNSGALSVIGRSANSTGDPADISASAASDAVLRESGSTVGFGTIATAGITDAAVTYAKIQDVTAASRVLGRGSASGSGDVEELTLGSGMTLSGTVLSSTATATGNGLLGYKQYVPATNQTFSVSSSTFAAIDTTNLRVTFTAPATGNVLVRLTAYTDYNSAANQYGWGLLSGASAVNGSGGVASRIATQGTGASVSVAFILTGLSGSYTWDWAHATDGNGTGRILCGPGMSSTTWQTNNFSPCVMEVWAVP